MNFRMTYYCPDCNETWEDTWSNIVNSKCPDCRREYTAEQVDDVDDATIED